MEDKCIKMKCIYYRESFEFVGVQTNPANDQNSSLGFVMIGTALMSCAVLITGYRKDN